MSPTIQMKSTQAIANKPQLQLGSQVDILTPALATVIPNITVWASSFCDPTYLKEFPHSNRGRCLQRRYRFPCAPRYAIPVLIYFAQHSNRGLKQIHNADKYVFFDLAISSQPFGN